MVRSAALQKGVLDFASNNPVSALETVRLGAKWAVVSGALEDLPFAETLQKIDMLWAFGSGMDGLRSLFKTLSLAHKAAAHRWNHDTDWYKLGSELVKVGKGGLLAAAYFAPLYGFVTKRAARVAGIAGRCLRVVDAVNTLYMTSLNAKTASSPDLDEALRVQFTAQVVGASIGIALDLIFLVGECYLMISLAPQAQLALSTAMIASQLTNEVAKAAIRLHSEPVEVTDGK